MENKKRAIYAEDLLRTIRDDQHIRGSAFARVKQHIDDAATVEDVEVVHARWEHLGGDEWCCTACGEVITTEGSWEKPTKKFCNECGAKMDGDGNG